MKLLPAILFFAIVALAPAKVSACAACGSGNSQIIDSPMVDGMNLGILTLGAGRKLQKQNQKKAALTDEA